MNKDPVTIAAIKISGSRRLREFTRAFFLVLGILAFIGGFFLIRLGMCSDNTDKAKLRECVVGPFNR